MNKEIPPVHLERKYVLESRQVCQLRRRTCGRAAHPIGSLSAELFTYSAMFSPGEFLCDECQNAYRSSPVPTYWPNKSESYDLALMAFCRSLYSNMLTVTFAPIARHSSATIFAAAERSGESAVVMENANVWFSCSLSLHTRHPFLASNHLFQECLWPERYFEHCQRIKVRDGALRDWAVYGYSISVQDLADYLLAIDCQRQCLTYCFIGKNRILILIEKYAKESRHGIG